MAHSESEPTHAARPTHPARHGWARRHRVALAALAALLLLYGVAGFVLLPRLGRNAIVHYVEHDLGRKVSIGAVRFNPVTLTLEMRDFSLREADQRPLLGFELLRVRASWRSLTYWTWTLGEVRLDRPQIHAVIDREGRLNLAQLIPATPPGAPAAAPGSMPAVRVLAFTVHAGNLLLDDRSRERPFTAVLAPIEFALIDFRTIPAFQNRYRFSAATSAQERLDWSGEFSLQPLGSSGEFRVTALKASTVAAYLQDALPFALSSGSIDLSGAYRYTTGAHGGLSLQLPSLKLHALNIGPRGEAASAEAPWIALPELDVADTAIDLDARSVTVGQIAVSNPALRVWREADGSLNLPQLLVAPGPAATPAAAAIPAAAATPAAAVNPAPGAPAAAAWRIALGQLRIDGASVDAEDRSVKPAVQMRLAPIAFTVQHYSSAQGAPLAFMLATGIGASGQFTSQGSLVLSPLSAALDFTLKGLDLSALQPYLARATQVTVYRGRLASDGHVDYAASPAKATPTLRLQLNAQIMDLATRDDVLNADLIAWHTLRVGSLRYQQQPDALEISQIVLNGADARIVIGADGKLNLVQILSTPRAQPPAASAPQTGVVTATNTLPVRIGRVEIEDSAAEFSDRSIQPNFSAAILGLHGSIVGLSSDPAARATVDLDGSVDQYAPVVIKGQINPLAATSYTDIGLSFQNIELTTFNPYSGKFAGYSIAQGKLTTDLHYHVENRRLQATHHIVIDQLEFGAATDSKQAVPLPVKLAVSLLKDRNGVIDLQLPVDGSLDDPDFHVAPVVGQVLEGLVRRIVSAPFALLGSLFGGGEELAYVDFPAGSATLQSAQAAKLAQLATALIERPQLKLDIPLHAQNDDDELAFERAALEQALGTAVLPAPPRRTSAAPPAAGDARLPALLALYRDRFQTEPAYPPDVLAGPAGDAARADWLAQQLLTQFAPGPEQLNELGHSRAVAVQAGILGTEGLAAERVFLTDRASGGSGADGAVRMELKLQ